MLCYFFFVVYFDGVGGGLLLYVLVSFLCSEYVIDEYDLDFKF